MTAEHFERLIGGIMEDYLETGEVCSNMVDDVIALMNSFGYIKMAYDLEECFEMMENCNNA